MISKKNLILILASMATFVEALDIAIINLTIPSIQAQFGVSAESIQWLQSLYVLFFGGFLIIGGKISDSLGKKKVFIIGSTFFMLASLGAGLSSSFEGLALFRAIQGLAAAFVMPAASSIVTSTFTDEKERSKALGVFSSFAAIGSGCGLSAGGIISTYLGWHWVFLINVPILTVIIIGAIYAMDKDVRTKVESKADVFSGLLLIAAVLLLTYGIHNLGSIATQPLLVVGTLALATLLLTVLIKRLKTVSNPLFDLSIFQHKTLVLSNCMFFVLGGFFVGFLFLISMMLQKDMNYSAAAAGLLLVPFSVLSTLVAKFAIPTLLKKLDTRQLGILGMCFMLAGGLLLCGSVLFGHPLAMVLIAAACISGIGMTICYTSFAVFSVKEVPAAHYGITSSLTSTTYFVGAGIGLSIITIFMQLMPTENAVGILGTAVLAAYAFIGILILLGYQGKK